MLVVLGLVAVATVDADGDPMTTNVPAIVLGTDVEIATGENIGRAWREPGAPRARTGCMALRRRAGESLRFVVGHLWRPRVQPIRGP